MRKFKLTFKGRKLGAIGTFSNFTVKQHADNPDEAGIALYDNFEHITELTVTEITKVKRANSARY